MMESTPLANREFCENGDFVPVGSQGDRENLQVA
jgi:hypothetical protein